MARPPIRCLVLACGNTLRGDDGAGPWLASWANEKFRGQTDVRIVSRQQWTPDIAQDLARSEAAIFIDASLLTAPGTLRVDSIAPAPATSGVATHHLNAPELLALANELYTFIPRYSLLLTIGAASMDLGEEFSQPVRNVLDEACALLEDLVSDPGGTMAIGCAG